MINFIFFFEIIALYFFSLFSFKPPKVLHAGSSSRTPNSVCRTCIRHVSFLYHSLASPDGLSICALAFYHEHWKRSLTSCPQLILSSELTPSCSVFSVILLHQFLPLFHNSAFPYFLQENVLNVLFQNRIFGPLYCSL